MLVSTNDWAQEKHVGCKQKYRVLSEPFIVLYTLTHGILFTTVPQVLLSKSCQTKYNESLCNSIDSNVYKAERADAFSIAAVWNSALTITTITISCLFILPFGALSDMISKRKLMIIPPTLRALQSLIFILGIQLKGPHMELFVIGAGLTGIYGDINGALNLGSSFMAGGTPDSTERTVRLIGLGACTYAGSGIGAYLSGILANKYGFTYSFILSTSISLINIALVIFVVPNEDSRQMIDMQSRPNQEITQSDRCMYIFKATKQTFVGIFQFTRRYCFSKESSTIWMLLASYFFAILCLNGETTIITLFVKHSPLSLSPVLLGEYVLLLMAVRGFGGFVLFLLISCLTLADSFVVFLGFLSFIGTYVSMGLSHTQNQLFGFASLSVGYPLTLSGIRSCLTKKVTAAEHGIVLSFASFISLLGSIIMSYTISSLFKYTAEIFPGICMLFLAGWSSLGLIFALVASGVDRCSCAAENENGEVPDEAFYGQSSKPNNRLEKMPLLNLHNRKK